MKSVKMNELPLEERPRERLMELGPKRLNNSELLSIIISVGSRKENALNLASRLLSIHDIEKLSILSVSELKKILGIKDAKACSLVAAFELGRRAKACKKSKHPIKDPQTIARMLLDELADKEKESLMCVYLDSKLNALKYEIVAFGGLNSNSVNAAEVFRTAIKDAAAGIILAHNHPSGDPAPSKKDIEFTAKVREAGKIIGIEIMDHVIAGDGNYVSFKESGLL